MQVNYRRSIVRGALSLLLLAGIAGCSRPPAVAEGKTISGPEALRLARAKFVESGRGPLAKYDVSLVQDNQGENWLVLFKGKGEFARPGNHVLITVNRKSGETRLVPGR